MKKMGKKNLNKSLFVFSLIMLLAIPASGYRLGDSTYWGLWETEKGRSPSIQIEIKRGKRTNVVIDGKKNEMDYNVVVSKHNHVLLEFDKTIVDKKTGSEVWTSIYLIGGSINKHPVLQGFYSYTHYNEEGVGIKSKFLPITLYRLKRYEGKD